MVTALAVAPAAVAAPGPPFACRTPTIFVAQGVPTQLDALTYRIGSTSFVPIGQPQPHYNAIAFNPLDGFIYASGLAQGAIGDILQVDSRGALTSTGLTVPANSNVGAFDARGNYFAMNSATRTLYKVNLEARTIAPIALSAVPDAQDLTFVGGVLWGRAASGALVRVDPATGVVSAFAQTVIPPGDRVGAAWTYANDNLGLSYNRAGTVYQVKIANPTAAAPTFTLVSSATGPASGNNDGTSCPGQPVDLGIAKTAPASVDRGAQISWTLVVHNYGPGISSGFTVADAVPASVTDVATSTAGCSVTDNALRCVDGVLQPGDDATITLTGTAPSTYATTIENTAVVTGNDADPEAGNDTSTSVTGTPAAAELAIAASAAPDPVAPGATVTYALEVTNDGPSAADRVSVSDPLPAGLSFVSASSACTRASGTVTCDLPSLAAGATARFQVVAAVATAAKGPIANTATVASATLDPAGANNSSTATVQTTAPNGPSSAVVPSGTPMPPACTGHRIVLLDVHRTAGRVEVSGLARTSYRGMRASIRPLNAGRRGRSVTATIQQDGSFRTTLPLPPLQQRATIRYQATIAGARSFALKLVRQLTIVGRRATVAGTRVTAQLSRPTRRQAVTIRRQLTCTTYRSLAIVHTNRGGRFTITLPAPNAPDLIAYYRATIRRSHGRTYTLPIAVRAAAP